MPVLLGLLVGAAIIIMGEIQSIKAGTPDFKLSEHFTFYELTGTGHKDLLEANRAAAVAYQTKLRDLAAKLLEPIRAAAKVPILVSSGFRFPPLNELVGGEANSQHMSGLACDITAKGMSNDALFSLIRALGLPYDQVIHEGGWIHVSLGDRRQALVYRGGSYFLA